MKATQVENLSKSYLVGHNNTKAESYTALRDVLARNAKNLARKTRDMLTGRQIVQGDEVEEFWALKDITTKSSPGDRVGIFGRNGAGKSTLLKILSRITEPTTSRVTINARVASLLEVGTGFHRRGSPTTPQGREGWSNGGLVDKTRPQPLALRTRGGQRLHSRHPHTDLVRVSDSVFLSVTLRWHPAAMPSSSGTRPARYGSLKAMR